MITFFTIPKPFTRKTALESHITDIQTMAMRSWKRLHGLNQIILFGDEENMNWFADEHGFLHLEKVPKSKYGTPYLNYIFDWANRAATNDILCYINSDIILCDDFIKSIKGFLGIHRVKSFPEEKFLLTGSHYDVNYRFASMYDVSEEWEPGFDSFFAKQVRQLGRYHKHGLDYFVYKKGMFSTIPHFVIGRGTWDNYLIYYAQNVDHAPAVDATQCITAVHMDHEYTGASKTLFGHFKGHESYQNYLLAKDWRHISTIDDVDYVLDCKGGYSLQLPPYRFPVIRDMKRAVIWNVRSYRAQWVLDT